MTIVDDNYTGHVEPGTAAKRILPGVSILKASVGPMDNNAYLVTCSATGQTLLIDAANDADVLIDLVRNHAPKVSLIVTSHQHFDHWQALEALAQATGAPTAAHQIDADPLPVKPDRLLAGGDTVQIGELTFEVIHLRGHTPGSVALALDGPATGDVTQLFTGDCLFPGGVGKTWQPGDFTGCSRTSPPECSTSTATPPSSIPVTVTTPRWAPSARTLPTGASGVGERRSPEGLGMIPQGAVSGVGERGEALLVRHFGEDLAQRFALFGVKPGCQPMIPLAE